MKRFVLAFLLCSAMLGTGVFLFIPSGLAQELTLPAQARANLPAQIKENVLQALLDLPSPAPPNPLETGGQRDESFYDPKKPPPDDAPIDDLIDYWTRQSESYRGSLYYLAKPTDKVAERLLGELQRDPEQFVRLMNVLPEDRRTADVVKGIYDSPRAPGGTGETRERLKQWLTVNSNYFVDDLERVALKTRDSGGYVNIDHETNVLALTTQDWDRAKPIVDRMYNDGANPVSKVLATWALYKHAMQASDVGDTDRYRSELMRYVEDKSMSDGVRDKANDALAHESDFPGRDEWTISLFEDETLVKMDRFTMLTTLVMYSPPEKYVPKLLPLLDSRNKLVRQAAVRNLLIVFDRGKDPAIMKAMLPWLEDPKWIDLEPDNPGRMSILYQLVNIKMPESVPGLIAALDERASRTVTDDPNVVSNTNANAASVRLSRSAANTAANSDSAVKTRTETYYPLRDMAVRALATQADQRAAPALRRLLAVTKEDYQRQEVMRALFACGGFSVAEQIDALEYYAKVSIDAGANIDVRQELYPGNYANTGAVQQYIDQYVARSGPADAASDLKFMLGGLVASISQPSDALVRTAIDRVEELEKRDVLLAQTLRRIVMNWRGPAITTLIVRDLKNGRADANAIVRLLGERKFLREKLAADIADARTGTPVAAGISACILEDDAGYENILNGKEVDQRTALYACARLIRAMLPLSKAAQDLKSNNELLKSAAELYLESEDSSEARDMVRAQHPDEPKILGATAFFKGRSGGVGFSAELITLFESVEGVTGAPNMYGPGFDAEINKEEERLQKEVKEDADLVGIYAYRENYVRIYKDKAVFSWQDDPSRYHERALSKEEFDVLKNFLAVHNVAELKPFLSCYRGCGIGRELLMVGKNGGSRVFVRSDRSPAFFVGLEGIFDQFRSEAAAIKYALSKDVPGLELLFAADGLEAQTVWKQGSDLRVVVSNAQIRAKVEEEISRVEESELDDTSDEEPVPEDSPQTQYAPEFVKPSERMRERRQYEGFEWHNLDNGRLGAAAAQPFGIEYIPMRDPLDVQPGQEQWKARSSGFEIRVGANGIYKAAGGKLTRLAAGQYETPVVSPNGRWVVLTKFDEEAGPSAVRFNLLTRREFKINYDGYGTLAARCFIPAIGKFLLVAGYYDEGDSVPDDDEDTDPEDPKDHRYYLLDADSGVLTPAFGNLKPLIQQTFRPLQSTGKPNEFWAALSDREKNETVVGTYDPRLFRFTAVRRLPKISFDSMDMWVDQAEGKVYFVYNGHLLSVPLRAPTQPVR